MLSAPASCNDAFARSAAGSRASCNNVSDPSCSASAAAAAPSRASRRNGGTLRPAALSSRRITRIAAAGAQSSSSSSDSSGSERLDALQQRANQVKAMRAAANYLELLNDEDVDIDDEEEVVARSLGMKTKAELSPTQRKYAERIAQSLAEKAAAMAKKQAEEKKVLLAGQHFFEIGQYANAVEVFEKVLPECALWLALAYDAAGRRDDALDVYRRLENTHPSAKVKKQAYGLRFILEAPELEISPEERVSLPNGVEAADGQYSDKWARNAPPKRKIKMTWEDEFWQKYEPPAALTNRYVLAATSVLSLGVAIYSAMHIRPH